MVGELAVVEVAPLLTILTTLDGVATGTAATGTAATGVTGVGGVATATGVAAIVAIGVAAGGVETFAREIMPQMESVIELFSISVPKRRNASCKVGLVELDRLTWAVERPRSRFDM